MRDKVLHKFFVFGLATVFSFLFAPVLHAQKMKVQVQMPDTAVLAQWFEIQYTVYPVPKDTKLKYDLSNSKFEVFKIKDTWHNDTVSVNYMLRAKGDLGRKKAPRLNVYQDGKTRKSKTPQITVVPSYVEWKFEDEKIRAFITAEVSKPIMGKRDTVQVRYKLYFSYVDLYDIQLKEVHVPSSTNFYSTEIDLKNNESGSRFLGDVIKGRVYRESDLGGFILQPRKMGDVKMGKGYMIIDYVVDHSNLAQKLFLNERKIPNNRRQAIIPFGEAMVKVVE